MGGRKSPPPSPPTARAMAGLVPRVRYLANLCSPARGPASGWPHVRSLGSEIFVCTGGRLVYVYNREGALLTVSAAGRRGGAGRGGAAAGRREN